MQLFVVIHTSVCSLLFLAIHPNREPFYQHGTKCYSLLLITDIPWCPHVMPSPPPTPRPRHTLNQQSQHQGRPCLNILTRPTSYFLTSLWVCRINSSNEWSLFSWLSQAVWPQRDIMFSHCNTSVISFIQTQSKHISIWATILTGRWSHTKAAISHYPTPLDLTPNIEPDQRFTSHSLHNGHFTMDKAYLPLSLPVNEENIKMKWQRWKNLV